MKRTTLVVIIDAVCFFGVATAFFLFIGKSPLPLLGNMVIYAFGDLYSLSETMVKATPIMLCALAIIVPARLGLVSVGADGQLYFGALIGTAAMLAGAAEPGWWLLPLVLAAAMAGGAAWGALAGALKAKIGVHETISTLLLNFVALLFVNHFVYGSWRDPANLGWPSTIPFPDVSKVPSLFDTRIHAGLLFALAGSVIGHAWLVRSRFGVALNVLRENRKVGDMVGLNYGRNVVVTMAIGGAIAGFAGICEAAAIQGRLQPGLSAGYGLTGFLVAWLSGHSFLWAVPISILIGGLITAGDALQLFAKVPASSAIILQGLLFATALAVAGVDRQWRSNHG
ncbi:MAG: ABC transporter permease [Burkholderiales bacterium]|nr:ABC transporter permease [Burkholderiales bacterium]